MSDQHFSFGAFEVDWEAGEVRKHGIRLKLQEQPFQVLALLLRRSGKVVTREELRSQLWSADSFVEFEHGLHSAINKLREALGDSADNPRFVETLPRRGYRFVGTVDSVSGPAPALDIGRGMQAQTAARTATSEVPTSPETAGPMLVSRRRDHSVLVAVGTLAAFVVVLAGLNVGGWRDRLLGRGAAPPHIKSLAVLPLANLSGDPAQEYFADGMTEALISNLAQIRALSRVISRTSVMRYKGSRKSLPEIAQELNVDAVIEGTVQRSGGRVRVTAKLIPAATDSPLWARDYERDLSDVLKLQSDVARAVADEIRLQVTPEERARLAAARNINPEAHDAYLLGRHHLRTNEDDLRQAIEQFDRAIQLAPDYAAAYAGLSIAWRVRGRFGAKDVKEVLPFARDAAVKAVALDPQLAEAHVALSAVKGKDWAGAEQELIRALELDPNNAEAHEGYADLLMA